jgi:mRNA-degrading endonuclease toxin of MazEF toxin-antitoxin module
LTTAFRQGDVYLSYDFYGEGEHLVLVVSREDLNRGNYVVTVMFTSKRLEERKNSPNCVFFPSGDYPWLSEDCVVQAESISQVPHRYLDHQRGLVGRVDEEKMREVILAIGYVLDATLEPG